MYKVRKARGRIWRWMLTVLALIHAARTYFIQELLTLLLFFTLAFAMLFLLADFSLVSAGRAAHSHQGRSRQPARTLRVLRAEWRKRGRVAFLAAPSRRIGVGTLSRFRRR